MPRSPCTTLDLDLDQAPCVVSVDAVSGGPSSHVACDRPRSPSPSQSRTVICIQSATADARQPVWSDPKPSDLTAQKSHFAPTSHTVTRRRLRLVFDLPPPGGGKVVLPLPFLEGGFCVDCLNLQSVAWRKAGVCVSKPLRSLIVVHTVPHWLNTYLGIVCVPLCFSFRGFFGNIQTSAYILILFWKISRLSHFWSIYICVKKTKKNEVKNLLAFAFKTRVTFDRNAAVVFVSFECAFFVVFTIKLCLPWNVNNF